MFKGLYILATQEYRDGDNDGKYTIWAGHDAVNASGKCAAAMRNSFSDYFRYAFIIAEISSAPYYIPAARVGRIICSDASEYQRLTDKALSDALATPKDLREAIAGTLSIARGQYFQAFDVVEQEDREYFADNGDAILKDFSI